MQWWYDSKIDQLSGTEDRPRSEECLREDNLELFLDLFSRFAFEKPGRRPC